MRRFPQALIVLILAFACAAAPVLGQTTGTIRGKVTDTDGGVLPGVMVQVTGDLVRGERFAYTNENGTYAISGIPPGLVTVSATLDGFEGRPAEDVKVSISGTATVDLVLQPGTLTEEITVTGERPLIDQASNAVSTNYSAEFLEDLPTSRFFPELMATAPGVSPASEGATRFAVFGSSTSSNTWNIDGLDATAGDTGHAWWYINPDTIAEVQVLAIGAPAEFGAMSGAAVNVVTKSGTNDLELGLNYFGQFDELTETNVKGKIDEDTGELVRAPDGIGHTRDDFRNVTLTAGGPFQVDKAWFFAALEDSTDAVTPPGVNRNLAEPVEWQRADIKLTFLANDSNTLEVKGHYEEYDWASDPSPFATQSATAHEFGENPAWSLRWTSVVSEKSFLDVHFAGWTGDDYWRSITGSTEPPFIDFTQPVPLESGGISYPYDYYLSRDQADVKLSHFADDLMGGEHEFKFGVQYHDAGAKTIVQPGFGGVYYWKYEYYPGYPYYYKYERLPHYYGSEAEGLSAFVDDSWAVNDKVTVNVGVRFDQNTADIPAYARLDWDGNPTGEIIPGVSDVVDWSTVSPRIGITAQVGEKGVVRAFYGKFYDGNVTGNWNWPPPDLPTAVYSYSYYASGPFYAYRYLTADNVGLPDPDMDPPETDQFVIGYEHQVGTDMAFSILGVHKETTNLIGWEVLDDGVLEPVTVTLASGREVTLLNIVEQPTIRKGNRPGAGSIAPDARYEQEYDGVVLAFNKRWSNGWSLQSSYTWSESSGRIPRMFEQVQHTPFYGSLEASDPNNHLNADQLLQGDRKHVFQLQANFNLPWQLDGSAIYKYLGGRPYALIDNVVLNQGRVQVIDVPASDDQRLPDQNILDLGIGRPFELGSDRLFRIDFQVFNVFNEDANDFWEGSAYGRGQLVAEDFILPRRVMLRFRLEL